MTTQKKNPQRLWPLFLIFLRMGLTSFGGPVAHLAYFRSEFVTRRYWLSEASYADLVALCQFLPGPSSSQVGLALGWLRAGVWGALAAWLGFTLPSAIVLTLFALGLSQWHTLVSAGLLHGLQIVALAVVAQAVWGMARQLCRGWQRIGLMLMATWAVLLWPGAGMQVGVIGVAALVGWLLLKAPGSLVHQALPVHLSRRRAGWLLLLFFGLLFGLPLLAACWPDRTLALFNLFYRAGALVFGGGHVVLPMLQASVVEGGWLPNDIFLAGYGLAQAVPGPLFTFAAFLGASMSLTPNGPLGALLCLVAIFLPSFLLVGGVLPFWENLRRSAATQAALSGINAAVVGLLLGALIHPLWSGELHGLTDIGLVILALLALMVWKLPPWLVVMGGALAGWLV